MMTKFYQNRRHLQIKILIFRRCRRKTKWVQKMLASSIFFSFHNIFKKAHVLMCLYSASLLKTLWKKEKLLVTSNFSFSHSVFSPFCKFLCHFHQICKFFQFGRVYNLLFGNGILEIIWKRVSSYR